VSASKSVQILPSKVDLIRVCALRSITAPRTHRVPSTRRRWPVCRTEGGRLGV